jgi:hypothetical protein
MNDKLCFRARYADGSLSGQECVRLEPGECEQTRMRQWQKQFGADNVLFYKNGKRVHPDGTACACPRCKGPRNRPPQPHPDRSGKRPPKIPTRIVAEDVEMDPDGDMQEEEAFVEPQWHADGDRKKPKRPAADAPQAGPTDEEAHGQRMRLLSSLLEHIYALHRAGHRRGKEMEFLRAEVRAHVALLPKTMAGEQLRLTAERILAETAPRRDSPARRRQFLAWNNIH